MGHFARTVGIAIAFWISVVGPYESTAAAVMSPAQAACIPASQCCKICDAGYACGNTCISRAKQCHKGRGCACNASEVCGEK